jgi:hypothetical protein
MNFKPTSFNLTATKAAHLSTMIILSGPYYWRMKVYPRDKYIFWNLISVLKCLPASRMNFESTSFNSTTSKVADLSTMHDYLLLLGLEIIFLKSSQALLGITI